MIDLALVAFDPNYMKDQKMKSSVTFLRLLILSSLLTLSMPFTSNADTQFDGGDAHDGPPNKHFGHGDLALHFPPELQLSESQRDKIFSIKHTQEALFYEQGKIVRKSHLELHKLANSDQYDDEKAKAISDKLGKALATITFLKVREKHQIFALLTPEQRNFLKSNHFGHGEGHSMHLNRPEGDQSAPSAHS